METAVMEGGKEAEMTGTSPMKNRPWQMPPEVEILNIFQAITRIYEIWRALLMLPQG